MHDGVGDRGHALAGDERAVLSGGGGVRVGLGGGGGVRHRCLLGSDSLACGGSSRSPDLPPHSNRPSRDKIVTTRSCGLDLIVRGYVFRNSSQRRFRQGFSTCRGSCAKWATVLASGTGNFRRQECRVSPRRSWWMGAPPILLVGTTQDAATTYGWAQHLAGSLRTAVLLSNEDIGHTCSLPVSPPPASPSRSSLTRRDPSRLTLAFCRALC
ncbi:alpha/beta hydrolase [Amycolatopsis sp. cmx-11-12]|uniref:alpha/beta hydrolase n=1 Tax=Amycolatopsis sp. cmx-11-12 TaxID=2785795 RepID=UPI003917F884